MKYAIIGAGGTGGILGFYMTKADRDVTLVARGRHLAAMQEKGLAVEKMWDGTTEIIPVKAMDMEHYDEQPDVVLVCVKGYSLEDTIPFIQRVAKPSTIVIPVLNIYGTGAKMQEKLPELVEKLKGANQELKYQLAEAKQKLMTARIAEIPADLENVLLFEI